VAPTGPPRIETARLRLARPAGADAGAIFERYASDPEVTQYLGWARHLSIDDTRAFIAFSEAEWARWPAGPYLAWGRDGTLLGATGLAFETPWRASTGYVLARDAWGRGYAGEALAAMVTLAPAVGVTRLYAICHPDHLASRRVLERGGFAFEAILRSYAVFPNLAAGVPTDCACYAMAFERTAAAGAEGG
jgi:ribosomal-protein-alanine N-acetyltransferase